MPHQVLPRNEPNMHSGMVTFPMSLGILAEGNPAGQKYKSSNPYATPNVSSSLLRSVYAANRLTRQ